MKTTHYLFVLFLIISGSVSAQMNKTDVQSFFNEADVSSVDYILLIADVKFSTETQSYITQRSNYQAAVTEITFKETCFCLKNSEDLIYIPYTSIRSLYKGKDGWEDQLDKPIIKIDLIGNRNVDFN
ncbi:MAG: hypothetical protein C0597_10290 [Marinilabiliales bacterium]|nr:MAG: hypothetical protein C0597_10290 [Marinilabiliales bacterium]